MSIKAYAQALVQERTGRPVEDLLRELYVDKRHSQQEIANALQVSRSTVAAWLVDFGITRGDRAAVAL